MDHNQRDTVAFATRSRSGGELWRMEVAQQQFVDGCLFGADARLHALACRNGSYGLSLLVPSPARCLQASRTEPSLAQAVGVGRTIK